MVSGESVDSLKNVGVGLACEANSRLIGRVDSGTVVAAVVVVSVSGMRTGSQLSKAEVWSLSSGVNVFTTALYGMRGLN